MDVQITALATKVARGKGLNADDRELMGVILEGDAKTRTEYKALVLELGKKVEKLTVELLDGQGKFGRYMKVNVPGSYKSLNMGRKKFVRFMSAVESIGYDVILNAFDDTSKPCSWEIESD